MLVDASLEKSKIGLNGYVSQPNKMFRECFAVFQPVKVKIELFDESLSTGKLLYGNLDPTTYNDSSEKRQTFERVLNNVQDNMRNLMHKFEDMNQKELDHYPDLVKNIKSLLASRFSSINDNNSKEIERFIEDNHHLRYLTDMGQIQFIISEKLNNRAETAE